MTIHRSGNASSAGDTAPSRATASPFFRKTLIALTLMASCARPDFKVGGLSVYVYSGLDEETIKDGVAKGAVCAEAHTGWSSDDEANVHVDKKPIKSPSGRTVSGYALCAQRHIAAGYGASPGEFPSLMCHEIAHIALCDSGMDDPNHLLLIWEEIDRPILY